MKQKIKIVSTKDIRPAPYNPRFMSEESRKGLSKSIERFGDLSGITWNKKTKNLVTGHQRWAELNAKFDDLQLKPTRVGYFDIISKKSGPTGFDIRIVDWDRQTEAAANVTANNTYIQGEFDTESLQKALVDIQKVFSMEELEALNLNHLILGEWVSDISSIEKTQENLDGIVAKIVISCKQEDREGVFDTIRKALKKEPFEGVSIA